LRHADALDHTGLEADGGLSGRSEHEHVVDDLAERLELVPAVQTTAEMLERSTAVLARESAERELRQQQANVGAR
jgi:hypothetical protein